MGQKLKKLKGRALSSDKILLAFLILILLAGASVYAYRQLSSSAAIDAPSDFATTAGNMQIGLSWKKSDSDQVLVIYKTAGYPTSPTDGTLLYEGNGTSYTHTDLVYGKTYYYRIWSTKAVEGEWEYSNKGAFASASPYWRGLDGEKIQEYVEFNGARIVGADGHYVELSNSPQARNPTWQALEQFLWQDTTDQHLYNENSFVCADYAEMLHNNAEKAGIRAAFVSIDLSSSSSGHALNAFNTTDRGLIYIDDTGTERGGLNADKTVNLANGSAYIPISIFPNPGYESQWESLGTVTGIRIQW